MQVLQVHLELPRCILGEAEVDYPAAAALLQRFTRKQELRWGQAGWQSRISQRGSVLHSAQHRAAPRSAR